ncbi:MAG: Carboxylesterase, type [Bryobacterales bacterium]|nr:Carboxylesterase, type [Bryobacterales bacterium]
MKLQHRVLIPLALAIMLSAMAAPDRVKTANGTIEGTGLQTSGVREFKGIPFAEPPLGELRWAPPQPVKNWTNVRQTTQFGPRCMQQALFGDMGFRSNGMSEDCLYLNVWTPAKSAGEKFPVMVYFFGGGFMAGDGSEPRYDGESMASKGVVAVTVNYRLGVFGFLAHPDLTKESPHHASGNYALLDQSAALHWVQRNISAFGGDPRRVTIAGESAGSIAASAQMASPLAKDLIAGVIGESGSILGALAPVPLAKGEEQGVKFCSSLGASTIAAMRAMPTAQIFEAAGKPGVTRFNPTIDGYFLPESPVAIFAAGKQAHVPLLAGWNSEEMNGRAVVGREEPTPESFEKGVERLYGDHAQEVLKEYAATSNEEARRSATDLASDRFIAYSTWKWIDLAGKTGGKAVYRYFYARPRPRMNPEMGNVTAGLAGGVVRGQGAAVNPAPIPKGAVHSAEIEYALGNLATNKVYAWTPDDYKVSSTMEEYFANFVKTGNPNGAGLPKWPAVKSGDTVQFLRIDVETRAESEQHRGRYLVLDKLAGQP